MREKKTSENLRILSILFFCQLKIKRVLEEVEKSLEKNNEKLQVSCYKNKEKIEVKEKTIYRSILFEL